jgi:hypothetical protein
MIVFSPNDIIVFVGEKTLCVVICSLNDSGNKYPEMVNENVVLFIRSPSPTSVLSSKLEISERNLNRPGSPQYAPLE